MYISANYYRMLLRVSYRKQSHTSAPSTHVPFKGLDHDNMICVPKLPLLVTPKQQLQDVLDGINCTW